MCCLYDYNLCRLSSWIDLDLHISWSLSFRSKVCGAEGWDGVRSGGCAPSKSLLQQPGAVMPRCFRGKIRIWKPNRYHKVSIASWRKSLDHQAFELIWMRLRMFAWLMQGLDDLNGGAPHALWRLRMPPTREMKWGCLNDFMIYDKRDAWSGRNRTRKGKIPKTKRSYILQAKAPLAVVTNLAKRCLQLKDWQPGFVCKFWAGRTGKFLRAFFSDHSLDIYSLLWSFRTICHGR